MAVFFPKSANDPKDAEAASLLKKRALATYEAVADGRYGQDDTDLISIDQELLLLFPPKSFAGAASVEVRYIQEFERTVAIVSKWMGFNINNFTVLRLHQTLELIRKSNKPNHA